MISDMILAISILVGVAGAGDRQIIIARGTERRTDFWRLLPASASRAGLKQPLQRISHNTKYGECWL